MRSQADYPELGRADIKLTEMRERQRPAWPNTENNWTYQDRTIPAVHVIMPQEDWARLMSIYTAHYHAATENPAVIHAWQQYRMLAALSTPQEK